MPWDTTCGISSPFGLLSPTRGQVVYVLRDRSPLEPKLSFDLHTLGTPLAFVLSQDQTLHEILVGGPRLRSDRELAPPTPVGGKGST